MSNDFEWELEKLRRRFGVDGDELEAAAKRINRKRRGEPPFDDSEHLARVGAGTPPRQVVENIGGTFKDEIRISRKNRRERQRLEYLAKIAEFGDRITLLSQAEWIPWIDRLAEAAQAARLPEPHLMLFDVAHHLGRKVFDSGDLSAARADKLEQALFHLEHLDIELDTPRRRATRRVEIELIDRLIGELPK